MIQKYLASLLLLFFMLVSSVSAQIDIVGTRFNNTSGVTEVIRWDAITGQLNNVVPTTAANVAIGASVFDARFGKYYFRGSNSFNEIGFNPDTVRVLNPQFSMQSAEVNMNLGKIYGLNSILFRNSSGAIIGTQLDFVEYNIANSAETTLGTIPNLSGFLADGCAYNSNGGVYYFLGIDSTLGMCLYSILTYNSSFTFGQQQLSTSQTILNSLEYDNDYGKLYSLGASLTGQGSPSNLQIFEINPNTATITLEADLPAYFGFQLSTNTYHQGSNSLVFKAVGSASSDFLAWDTFNDSLYTLQIPVGNINEIEADNEEYALSKYATSAAEINIPSTSNIKIYPNPSSGVLNVAFEQVKDWQSLKVYNLLGEKLRDIENLSNNMAIDLSNLPAGQYFLRAEGNDKQVSMVFQTVGK